MLCWFAGTSSRGLPFVHDSFRPGPRPICHRPRPPSDPDDDHDANKAETDWQYPRQSHDNSREVSSHVQLPALGCRDMMTPTERHPASRSSYTLRFKACHRLKGIDPNKAHRADRRQIMTSTDALLDVRKRLVQSIFPKVGKDSAIDSPILSTIQESRTRGQVVDEVDLIRQVEEKLRHSSDHGYETKSSTGGPLLSERSRWVCRKGGKHVVRKSGLRHQKVVRDENEDRVLSDARGGPGAGFSCGTRRLLGGVLSPRKMEQLLKDTNPDLSRASRETVA